MKDTIFSKYVLPFALAGLGVLMQKYELYINIVGYSLIFVAIIIFIYSNTNYIKRFSSRIFGTNRTQKKNIQEISTFPSTPWLSGKDLMPTHNISHNQLMQHIRNGLPAYHGKTDVYKGTGNPSPLNDLEIDFLGFNKPPVFEAEIEKLWFKREDLEKYIKTHNKSLNSDRQKNVPAG